MENTRLANGIVFKLYTNKSNDFSEGKLPKQKSFCYIFASIAAGKGILITCQMTNRAFLTFGGTQGKALSSHHLSGVTMFTSHSKNLPRYCYEAETYPREHAGSLLRPVGSIRRLVRKKQDFSPRQIDSGNHLLVHEESVTHTCRLSCCFFAHGSRRDPNGETFHIYNTHNIIIIICKEVIIIMTPKNRSDAEGGIGNVIHSLRMIQDMTVKELSEKMGVTSSYICDVEANRKCPSLDKLEEFSSALGVNFQTLMYFYEAGKKCRYNHKRLLLGILQEMVKASPHTDDNEST